MAGGPSTAELAAAVSNSGGLGSVAGGYLTAEAFADLLEQTAALTPLVNANVFAPEQVRAAREDIERYAAALQPIAAELGVAELTVPEFSDDAFAAKIEVLLDLRPALASFTFGLPDRATVERLKGAGITVGVTVTNLQEAHAAAAADAQFLIVQGPEAGGHFSAHDQSAPASTADLASTLSQIRHSIRLPLIAAGGIATPAQAGALLAAGADCVSLGTRFLTTHEAGTKPSHKAALLSGDYTETAVTRTYSGRLARGLRNRFIDRMSPHEVIGYPEVHYLTGPLRAAANGDPEIINMWAGTGFAECTDQPAAAVVEEFATYLDTRRRTSVD